MANFFGGFIKRIEKPQDTHPPSVPQELSKYDNEYITYCIEQEKTISELESGLHTNDDPGEIAKKALAAACAFYDADWAGVMVDELLSIFARFEDYDGIHHFATQALNLVPENVKAQYWLVYSIYHSGVVALAKREIEKAKCRLTSEEFDTLQKFICKDESLPYGQLFD